MICKKIVPFDSYAKHIKEEHSKKPQKIHKP